MEDASHIASVLAAVLAALAFGLSLWLAIRLGQFKAPPALHIGVGHGAIIGRGLVEREPLTSIVYGATAPNDSQVIVNLPIVLSNRGKVPITSVQVRLQYPARNAIHDFSFMDKEASGMRFHEMTKRDLRTRSEVASAAIDYEVLRNGESMTIGEPMRLGGPYQTDGRELAELVANPGELPSRLLAIPGYGDRFPVVITVLSKELEPVSRLLYLYWFKGADLAWLTARWDQVVAAHWGGKKPAVGTYIKFFWEKSPLQRVATDLFVPKLRKTKSLNGTSIHFEIGEASHARLVHAMPTGVAKNMDAYPLSPIATRFQRWRDKAQ